ncbi:hypothetical protein D3C86_1841890 [compost metagenome]
MSTTFSNGKTPEFCIDIWFFNAFFLAEFLDLRHNFVDHILIVIIEIKRRFDWKTTTNIKRINFWRNFFQSCIDAKTFV